MDAKSIIYGETGIDQLTQWLRATNEPQDIETIVRKYLEILRELVLEDEK